MKELLPRPSYTPYLLIQSLSASVAPNIPKTCTLLAALGALQSPDPPRKLIEILKCGEAACTAGEDPESAIRAFAAQLFGECLPRALETLTIFEKGFDKDERMSLAVHKLTATLRANLACRQEDLFFELKVAKTDIAGKDDWLAARGSLSLRRPVAFS